MNSFAGDTFTTGGCKYEIIKPDQTPDDGPGTTVGDVQLVEYSGTAALSVGKVLVKETERGFEYRVTTIAPGAIKKRVAVTLGSDVTSIQAGVFSDAGTNKVAKVIFDNVQLTTIDAGAFSGVPVENADGSAKLDLSTVTSIGSNAFKGATLPTDAEVILTGITEIPEGLFSGVTKLIKTVQVNDKLTSVGKSAFEGCTKLVNFGYKFTLGLETAYFLPTKLEKVGDMAFKGAFPSNLTPLPLQFFPGGVSQIKEVGTEAFSGCAKLDNAKFAELFNAEVVSNVVKVNSLTTFGDKAFAGTNLTGKWDFTDLPMNNNKFGAGFAGTKIQTATLPANVKTIGRGAFEDCTALEEVALPTGLEKIEANAFKNANKLGSNGKSLDIPSSVTFIGEDAFTRTSETDGMVNSATVKQTAFTKFVQACTTIQAQNSTWTASGDATAWSGLKNAIKDASDAVKTILGADDANYILLNDASVSFDTPNVTTVYNFSSNSNQYYYFHGGMLSDGTIIPAGKGIFGLCKNRSTLYNSLNSANTTAQNNLTANPERTIRLLPNGQNNTMVSCNAHNSDGTTTALKPNNSYERTTLYVPMGLQSEYAGSESWGNAATKDNNSHLYTYGKPLTTNNIGYNGAFKYQVTEAWAPQYTYDSSTKTGSKMSPEVKLVGICSWDKYTKGTTTTSNSEYDALKTDGSKYTSVFSGTKLEIESIVVMAGENDNKPEYVYYTVVGVDALKYTPVDQAQYDHMYEFEKLETVTLPATLTTIGENAFNGAAGLKTIALPATLKSIGEKAFAGTGLESINIPARVTTIGANAFEGKLGDNNTFVGVRTFYLNWETAPEDIDEKAFGDVVQYDNAELNRTYLPRYAVMASDAAVTAFSNYGVPFTTEHMFQLAEGITIAKSRDANQNPIREFVNVTVDAKADGGVSRSLEIVDNNDILLLEVSKKITADVTYTRVFGSTNLQAWYVPFELKADKKQGAKFYKIYDTKVVEGTDGKPVTSLELVEVDADAPIKANVPYLVKPAEAKATYFKADGLKANVGQDDCKSVTVADVENKYTISGTYAEKKPTVVDGKITEGFYGLSNGVFHPATAKASMKACRIIMTSETNNSPYVKLHIMGDEEDETAILNMETGEVLSEPMYDLGGRRISSPVKGQIYIQGNVKKLAR